jgi:polyisoprenoid-binding protein YceI
MNYFTKNSFRMWSKDTTFYHSAGSIDHGISFYPEDGEMTRKLLVPMVATVLLICAAGRVSAADYTLDPAHAGVTFKIAHLGLSWTHGRFNDLSGAFVIDPDPSKCSFNLSIKTSSIDTNNKKRDEHLSSPDFFNVKQYPTITFQSTAVKPVKDGYEVTGNLTMHGQTKPITFALLGGRQAEFPKGVQRTGFSTDLTLKRSEFGMDTFKEALSDEVYISISFEGVRK